jgi:hypothetical protein
VSAEEWCGVKADDTSAMDNTADRQTGKQAEMEIESGRGGRGERRVRE